MQGSLSSRLRLLQSQGYKPGKTSPFARHCHGRDYIHCVEYDILSSLAELSRSDSLHPSLWHRLAPCRLLIAESAQPSWAKSWIAHSGLCIASSYRFQA